jgi:hypothetical protein
VRDFNASLFEPGYEPGPERRELCGQLPDHAGHVGGDAGHDEPEKQRHSAEPPAEYERDARRARHVPGFELVYQGIQEVGEAEREKDRGEHVAQPVHDVAPEQDRANNVHGAG